MRGLRPEGRRLVSAARLPGIALQPLCTALAEAHPARNRVEAVRELERALEQVGDDQELGAAIVFKLAAIHEYERLPAATPTVEIAAGSRSDCGRRAAACMARSCALLPDVLYLLGYPR